MKKVTNTNHRLKILSSTLKNRYLFTVLNCVVFLILFNSNTKAQIVILTSDVTQLCKGSSVTFTANADFTPMDYIWEVSHNGGLSYTNISGQNQSTYTTSSLLHNDRVIVKGLRRGQIGFEEITSNDIQVSVNSTNADINIISNATSGSIQFNGSNQYLTLSNPPSYGTGAFTIDGWFRLNAAPSNVAPILGSVSGATKDLSVLVKSNLNQISVDMYGNHADNFTVPTITLNVWHHLAVVRNASSSLTVFLDGQRSSTGTITVSTSYTSSGSVGKFQSNFLNGYLSNLRIVKGSALFDPTQTTITVPTSLTTAVTNTKLLLNAVTSSSLLTDGSGTQNSITNNGSATWSGGTPFLVNLNSSSNATISNATANGVWSSSNNSILQVNSSGLLTPISTGNATITYTVTSTTPFTCVSSESSLFSTTVPFVPPTASAQSKCSGSTVSSLSASGTDLKWYDVSSGGSVLSGTTTLATGTYYVTQTINGVESDRTSVAVTVIALPATPSVNVVNNCDGTSTLSTTATGNLLWSTTATTSPITVSSAGTYTVTQTINGCTSAPGSGVAAPISSTITITSHPTKLGIKVALNLVSSEVLTYTVSATSNTALSYQWYSNSVASNSGGVLIPGATNASYIPSTSSAYSAYFYCVVSIQNSSCSVTSDVSEKFTVCP